MLYEEKCLDYFEGMWSIAIYNKKTNKIFLSRDRFGEKPFHILKTNDGIYFGSEINYIKNLYSETIEINKKHLQNYLMLGYKSLYKYAVEYVGATPKFVDIEMFNGTISIESLKI